MIRVRAQVLGQLVDAPSAARSAPGQSRCPRWTPCLPMISRFASLLRVIEPPIYNESVVPAVACGSGMNSRVYGPRRVATDEISRRCGASRDRRRRDRDPRRGRERGGCGSCCVAGLCVAETVMTGLLGGGRAAVCLGRRGGCSTSSSPCPASARSVARSSSSGSRSRSAPSSSITPSGRLVRAVSSRSRRALARARTTPLGSARRAGAATGPGGRRDVPPRTPPASRCSPR